MKKMLMQNSYQAREERGFTLIEVTLSMGFIAFIITILAATTVNIVRTYTKGMWMSQVNSAGQQIIAGLGTTARYNSAPDVNNEKQRICFDNIVYAWNTADDIKDRNGKNQYNGTQYSLLRIEFNDGKGKNLCRSSSSNNINNSSDYTVSIAMGRGVQIMAISVKQSTLRPLLELKLTASTNGDNNRPYLSYTGRDGSMQTLADSRLRSYYNDGIAPSNIKDGEKPTWRCGDIIDGTFTPSDNQYCAFASYDVIMYERSIKQ